MTASKNRAGAQAGAAETKRKTITPKPRKDRVLAEAADQALQALQECTLDCYIGHHAGTEAEGERLLTHYFHCEKPGYVGWRWAVTMARVPRARKGTVCEIDLLPGDSALLAPPWVPWSQRLRPTDVSRGDVLPYMGDDDRLEDSSQPDDVTPSSRLEDTAAHVVKDLQTGRRRVLSKHGRQLAEERWAESEQGPSNSAIKSGATCSNCGFLVNLADSMQQSFGVCANEWSPDDGRVVALEHGCGSHSETDVPHRESAWPVTEIYLNELDLEVLPNPHAEDSCAEGESTAVTL